MKKKSLRVLKSLCVCACVCRCGCGCGCGCVGVVGVGECVCVYVCLCVELLIYGTEPCNFIIPDSALSTTPSLLPFLNRQLRSKAKDRVKSWQVLKSILS